ncbi:MAG: hypothetical protein U9R32_09975, partial [Bacteroidota bacterium]|nr:hypothetical protein [Bacteroidota bacterium]
LIYMVSYNPVKEDTAGMKGYQQDSLRFYNSDFLVDLDEEKLKMNFFSAFSDKFKAYGFNVIPELKISDSSQILIVSIPQMELEEYKKEYVDEEIIGNKRYYKNFDLDALSFNTWIALSTSKSDGKRVYFIHDTITDVVDGYFYYDFKKQLVKYRYKSHKMQTDDIYRFMKDMGKLYAQYIYNFYLNRYVDIHRKSDYTRKYLYHYNQPKDKLEFIIGLPWEKVKK